MGYFTGKTGEIDASGTTVNVTGWTADTATKLEETTHSGSAGFDTFVFGTRGCTGTMELNWDAAANPTTNPPNLKDGQTIANLHLYLEAGQGFLDVDNAMIGSVSYGVPVDGVATFSCSFTATGAFTEPIGNW